jgi:hypothetical protein
MDGERKEQSRGMRKESGMRESRVEQRIISHTKGFSVLAGPVNLAHGHSVEKKKWGQNEDYHYEVYAMRSPEMASDLKSLPSLVFFILYIFVSVHRTTSSTELRQSSSPRRYLQTSQLGSREIGLTCPKQFVRVPAPSIQSSGIALRDLSGSPIHISTARHGVNKVTYLLIRRIAPCQPQNSSL